MLVSVIIPTHNAAAYLGAQLDALLAQTVAAEIIVIDSGSEDDTVAIAGRYGERVKVMEIPAGTFDHGGTRHDALAQSKGEFVCFLTQDALPVGPTFLEELLRPFAAEDVAAVYGRQVAYSDAPAYERLTRAFNYPSQPRTWRETDIPRYGVKAFFFSNCAAAYRRSAYEAAGGFAAEEWERKLRVSCPGEMMALIPPEHRRAVMDILSQDPRPAYQQDPERVYGMAYGGMDIRFSVAGDELTVRQIILNQGGKNDV